MTPQEAKTRARLGRTELQDRLIWITGASSGIGEALAYALSRRGDRLVLSARRQGRLEAVRAACTRPEDHLVLPLDLAQPDTFASAVARVLEEMGPVDVLIHNGGVSQRAYVWETDLDVDRTIMEINYFGTIGLTKAVLPSMLERRAGHFVVITSVTGKIGVPLRTAYAASKHALHGFFDSLRAETWDRGLLVTLVCPGYIQTDLSRNALKGDGQRHDKMDDNQADGMPADVLAARIVRALDRQREEVYIGGKEILGIYLKRFWPKLLNRIVRK